MSARRALLLLLAVALALRVATAVALWHRLPVDDERAYDEIGRQLLEGEGFSTRQAVGFVNPGQGRPTSLWGCLQPLLVAAVYAVAGPVPGAVYLAHAVIGLATVWAGWALGCRAAGPRAGLVAGWALALDPYLLKLTATLMTESLYTALLAVALVLLVDLARGPSLRAAAGAGFLLGLASLARGLAFYLVPLVIAWLLGERRDRRRAAAEAALLALAVAVVIAPWVARNRRVHDRPVFLDTKAGWNLYAYLHPDFDSWRGNHVGVPAEALDPANSESRRDEILRQRALSFVRADPLNVLRQAPGKLATLWSPFKGAQTDPRLAPGKLLFVLPLELLALAGLVRLRLTEPVSRLLLVLILYYVAVHSLMAGGPRFRVPLDPALATLAGAALAPKTSAARKFNSNGEDPL